MRLGRQDTPLCDSFTDQYRSSASTCMITTYHFMSEMYKMIEVTKWLPILKKTSYARCASKPCSSKPHTGLAEA
jgi:hypothetical protein